MELEAYGHNKISIHALREEGDMRRSDLRALCHRFLSTPSARRATLQDCAQIYWLCISIHALREEGDFTEMPQTLAELQFLSTPSARRATVPRPCGSYRNPISIHALREEGDECHNKLLPGLHNISIHALREEGDKATFFRHNPQFKFLSTPSARRATARSQVHLCGNGAFLSTPSARRATYAIVDVLLCFFISIHALREEGDRILWDHFKRFMGISIHALREEGDWTTSWACRWTIYFYPRPPRGGRPH